LKKTSSWSDRWLNRTKGFHQQIHRQGEECGFAQPVCSTLKTPKHLTTTFQSSYAHLEFNMALVPHPGAFGPSSTYGYGQENPNGYTNYANAAFPGFAPNANRVTILNEDEAYPNHPTHESNGMGGYQPVRGRGKYVGGYGGYGGYALPTISTATSDKADSKDTNSSAGGGSPNRTNDGFDPEPESYLLGLYTLMPVNMSFWINVDKEGQPSGISFNVPFNKNSKKNAKN
jgi:hypothetical protein